MATPSQAFNFQKVNAKSKNLKLKMYLNSFAEKLPGNI